MIDIQQLIESSKFKNHKQVFEYQKTKKEMARTIRQTPVKKRSKEGKLNLHSRLNAAIQNNETFFNKGGQDEKALDYDLKQVYIPSISSSQGAAIFTRDSVLKSLRYLPPNVIITDFDQTITNVKSSRDYYEEFKAVRRRKHRILLWEDVIRLITLRMWSKKFPSRRNKLAFYKFLLPGLSADRIAHRHEINPNFIKAARVIQHYKPDAIFAICSVGIGQIVEKTIAKIRLNGFPLMLNIYEEEKGILTGNLINDYLFTESDKQDFPKNRIILGDDTDQNRLNLWPFFININAPGFEEKIREVLTQKKSEQQMPFKIGFNRRDIEVVAAT